MTHVVMLVTNDVSTDTRVKKEALAVARMGLQVTVLGTTFESAPWETTLGDVRILRVPVELALRDRRNQRRRARRAMLAAALARRTPPARPRRAASTPAATAATATAPATEPAPAAPAPAPAAPPRPQDLVYRAKRVYWKGRRLRRVYVTKALRTGDRYYRRAWSAYDARMIKVTYRARWRAMLPEVLDYERVLAPMIDQLRPDVIHAHDMQVVGIAAQAVERARAAGRDVPWVYDAHEFVPGLSEYGPRTRRVIAAWADLEQEYVRGATRVVTVSPAISTELQRRYRLPRRPAVVLNAPVVDPAEEPAPGLREVVGLPDGAPLVVYSGMVTTARGVQTAIEAMRSLPGVHLALVCVPSTQNWTVTQLRPLVTQGGLEDRVHFLEPVRPGQVVDFLRSADLGLLPFLHFPSHEMALANKMFEYVNAGLPVVVSDCRTQAEFVRSHRIGEVFAADDPEGLARAVRTVLDDRAAYAATVADPALREQYSWRRQEEVLRGVYGEVLHRPLEWTDGPAGGVVMDLRESPRGLETTTPARGA